MSYGRRLRTPPTAYRAYSMAEKGPDWHVEKQSNFQELELLTVAESGPNAKPELNVTEVNSGAPDKPDLPVRVDPAASAKAGYGAQIVKVSENHTYELDEAELEHVLMREEFRNLAVMVVSVAGAFRRGKSFLLNFFLRYLMSPLSAREDGSWLGEDSEPLFGFSWRAGSKKHTTGIFMWSEPIVLTLPSGEKVAVLLMDTQGTFDSESTDRDNFTIFALSTLLSSVQIYNLKENIQEDDMQHLQVFTEYGKLAQSESTAKPFQNLEFLVRDYPYDDFPCGKKGGDGLLSTILEVSEKTPADIKELRAQLHSNFEKISGFLLPRPGSRVSRSDYKGDIKVLKPEFRIYMIELAASLFSPEKLTIKTVNGQKIKARDLFNYFKNYMSVFNSNTLPTARNLMKVTIMSGLQSAMNESRELYDKGMNTECGPEQPSVPESDLQELHRKCMDAAREAFLTKKKMGPPKMADKYLEDLIKELDGRLPRFEENNLMKFQTMIKNAKDAYNKTIYNASNGNTLCLHPLDLQKVHQEGVEIAMNLFDNNRKTISSTKDDERSKLEHSFENTFERLHQKNELNNKTIVIELRSNYSKFMEAICALESPLRENDFRLEHEHALKIAQDDFETKRNTPSSYPEDIHKQNLLKEINAIFDQLNKMNTSKYKALTQTMMTHATNESRRLYENAMQLECEPERPCIPADDLETLHCKYLDAAKTMFTSNIAMGTQEEADLFLQELVKELDERLSSFQQINKSKFEKTTKKSEDMYEETIRNTLKDQKLCLHPLGLQQTHEEAVENAMKLFDANRKILFSNKTDDERSKFKEKFAKRYEGLRISNDQNNKTAVTEVLSQYSKFMGIKCSLEPPLMEDDFKREHEHAMRKALEEFSSKRNRPNAYLDDVYREHLITEINVMFVQLNNMNTSKYRTTVQAVLRHAVHEARLLYEKGMELECGPAQPSMPASDVENLHRQFMDTAKSSFTRNVTIGSKEETGKYLEELIEELQERLLRYQQNNTYKWYNTIKQAEDKYDETMRDIGKGHLFHPTDLQIAHQKSTTAAKQLYNANRKLIASKTDEDYTILEKSLMNRFDKLEFDNGQNTKTMVKEIHTEYWKSMENKCAIFPPLPENDFSSMHDRALKHALDEFNLRRNAPKDYPTDIHKEDLVNKITNTYTAFQLIYKSHRLEQESMIAEQSRNKSEMKRLKQEIEKLEKDKDIFRAEQKQYKIEQEKERKEEEKRRIDYETKLSEQNIREKRADEQREKERDARNQERQRDFERERMLSNYEELLVMERERLILEEDLIRRERRQRKKERDWERQWDSDSD